MDLASRARIAKPENLNRIVEYGRQCHANQVSGQTDLFASETSSLPPLELEEAEPWTEQEALEAERQAVGFYLSGHPLDDFFWKLRVANWYDELKRQNNLKYGSYLLNRPKAMKARKNVYRSR